MDELTIMQNKLGEVLAKAARPVRETIAQIERTGTMLDDYIAPTSALNFLNTEGQVRLLMDVDTQHSTYGLHQHAVGQIGDKLDVPPGYLKKLVGGEDWQREVAVEIMQRSSANGPRERVLIRTVEGEVRGFLSDKYRRLNSTQIFVSFLTAASMAESVLVSAHSGETKGFLEVIHPHVVKFDTPRNGCNYAVFGARIRNSDFGDGALELRTFMLNMRCLNGMVGESLLREFHLGGRIPENFQISEETYRKDTDARASMVADVMRQIYTPQNVQAMIDKINGASARLIDLQKEVEQLPKLGLTNGERDAVSKVLMEGNDANGVAGEPTLWKLVNGMTAVARDSKPERRRELEEIASALIK